MNDPTMTVLLVEDNMVERVAMRMALESAQIQVLETSTVADGLASFYQQSPDVVVIDLHLPDGSGYCLASYLLRQRHDLPLLMISADFSDPRYPPPRQRDGRLLAKLTKPFSGIDLLNAISRVVKATVNVIAHG